jgi:hypothetical protein
MSLFGPQITGRAYQSYGTRYEGVSWHLKDGGQAIGRSAAYDWANRNLCYLNWKTPSLLKEACRAVGDWEYAQRGYNFPPL